MVCEPLPPLLMRLVFLKHSIRICQRTNCSCAHFVTSMCQNSCKMICHYSQTLSLIFSQTPKSLSKTMETFKTRSKLLAINSTYKIKNHSTSRLCSYMILARCAMDSCWWDQQAAERLVITVFFKTHARVSEKTKCSSELMFLFLTLSQSLWVNFMDLQMHRPMSGRMVSSQSLCSMLARMMGLTSFGLCLTDLSMLFGLRT